MSFACRNTHRMMFLCVVSVFLFLLSTEVQAGMYSSSWEWGIVENNSGLYSTYASQLSVDVSKFGTMVDFTFSNDGPNAAAITGIYFEDGSLLDLAQVIVDDDVADDPTRSGIAFLQPASPGNMPGWSTLNPKFDSSAAFSVGSKGAPKGVSPGESLTLRYTLQGSKTFDDVITALNLGFTNPGPTAPRDSLRIGLHVQDIGAESDSLILTPVPGAVLLGILGLGVAGMKLRKWA